MKLFKYWLPTIIWMIVIFYFSSRQRVTVSDVFAVQFLFFKTLHVAEYAILFILLYRSLKNTRFGETWKNQIDAVIFSCVFAVTDEIHQVFVPTREGRLRDVGIDFIGIILGIIILWKLLPKAPKILKIWAKKLQLN